MFRLGTQADLPPLWSWQALSVAKAFVQVYGQAAATMGDIGEEANILIHVDFLHAYEYLNTLPDVDLPPMVSNVPTES